MLPTPAEIQPHLHARRVIWVCSIWMAITWLLLAFVQMIEEPRSIVMISINLCGVAAMVATMVLNSRRQWRAAGQVLVWSGWAIAMVTTAAIGGLLQAPLLTFPLLLLIATWVVGVSGMRQLLVATTLGLVALWIAQTQGWYVVDAHERHATETWVHAIGMLGLTAAIAMMARSGLTHTTTAAHKALQALEQNQGDLRMYFRAVEQNPESSVITDPQLNIVYVNDAFVTRSGFARIDVLGQPTSKFSTMGMDSAERERAMGLLADGIVWRGQMRNLSKQGEVLEEAVLVAPIRNSEGVVVNYVEIKRDLSEQVSAALHIHHLSHFDPLTGLPNRTQLIRKLKELSQGKGLDDEMRHGVLLLDMDRFTAFNDVRGSMRGDALLRALSVRLVEALPESAFVARIAADEFAVVLQDVGKDRVFVENVIQVTANALREALKPPLWLEETAEEIAVSGCIGGAEMISGGSDVSGNDTLRRASVALHHAKQSGLGAVIMFKPSMAEAADKRFLIENDLRRGIPAGELQLYLQTQANQHGHCVGAEVLVRWQHPRLGMVTPSVFIPVAEESDLIVLLGDWVLRQACILLARPEFAVWGLRLSVNVSSHQFSQVDFVYKLKNILKETGADPHHLTLEITEGVVMRDVNEATERMHELRHLGIELALDDFGTGYSSLAYLKSLPLQELKIDKSFIKDSHVHEDDSAMVEAILVLAKRMKLRVVAEGVETPEQAALLTSWNQGIVFQGYHYGRPLPVATWLPLVTGETRAEDNRWNAKVEGAIPTVF